MIVRTSAGVQVVCRLRAYVHGLLGTTGWSKPYEAGSTTLMSQDLLRDRVRDVGLRKTAGNRRQGYGCG